MSWSPHVTVAAVIRRQDQFLMVEEKPDGLPVINQPAGHLEFGESLIEAIIREVLEETCRVFQPRGLVGIYQWTVPDSDRTYLRVCFCGTVGNPLPDRQFDPDILANHWLSAGQIRGGSLPSRSPLVQRCLDDALNKEPIKLELLNALV